jgi:hypothetical protein
MKRRNFIKLLGGLPLVGLALKKAKVFPRPDEWQGPTVKSTFIEEKVVPMCGWCGLPQFSEVGWITIYDHTETKFNPHKWPDGVKKETCPDCLRVIGLKVTKIKGKYHWIDIATGKTFIT